MDKNRKIEIRKRLEDVTPTEDWARDRTNLTAYKDHDGSVAHVLYDDGDHLADVYDNMGLGFYDSLVWAEFFAHARQDIPDLLIALIAEEARALKLEKVVAVALEYAWQAEVIEPKMEEIEIGPQGYYADKSDWLESKRLEWEQQDD